MFKILSVLGGVTTLCFSERLILAIQNQHWLPSFYLDSPWLVFVVLSLSLWLFRYLVNRYSYRLKPFFRTTFISASLNTYLNTSLGSSFNFGPRSFATLLDGLLIFLLAAVYAQSVAQSQLNSRLPSYLDGADITITGTVVGLVERHELESYRQQDFYQRFLFKVDQFVNEPLNESDKQTSHYRPRLIQINNYQYLNLQSGQQWQFTVRLKQPRGNSNPGGFDYVRYLFAQRIDATGYIRSENTSRLINHGQAGWLTAIRASRVDALTEPLASLDNEGLLKALLLGDRSHLNPHDKQLLKRTGTSHLLAISGLHIGVAALFAALLVKGLLWLLPFAMHYWPRVVIIAVAALPVASFYAIVAGFSLSTRRALIMLSCFLVIVLLRRQTHLLQTLSLAALIILLIDPLAVLSPGFWFSFSAVAILLWASRAMRFSSTAINGTTVNGTTANKEPSTDLCNRQSKSPIQSISPIQTKYLGSKFTDKSKEKLAAFGLAQLAIFVAMPLVLSLFTGQGSLLTPIANFLAIPLVSLTVVPIGIAGLLISYFSLSLASSLFAIADFFLSWILFLLNALERFAAMLRHGPLNIDMLSYQASLPPMLFAIALISIIILLGKRGLPAYSAALIIWIVIFNPFHFAIYSQQSKLEAGDLIVTQLDVGQGSAILLSTANYHLLYDTGPRFSEAANAASNVIEPYLATMKIKALDTVIVSHGDDDHAGGANYLNEFGRVKSWLLGGTANIDSLKMPMDTTRFINTSDNNHSQSCHQGQVWARDDIRFEILHPSELKFKSENDQSCVLSVKSQQSDRALILLSGDISRRVESHLVQHSRAKLSADLLAVPHHGSASSSSVAFISAVRPSAALISAGHRNRYRHPHKAVIARYSDRDINIYRSDKLGAVQMIYRRGHWLGPYCARFKAKHFWDEHNNQGQCIGPITL